jgi:hypothetical protein
MITVSTTRRPRTRCALIVMTWPASSAPVATVAGQWQRLPDGRIQATGLSVSEFRLLTRMIREEPIK